MYTNDSIKMRQKVRKVWVPSKSKNRFWNLALDIDVKFAIIVDKCFEVGRSRPRKRTH
jgi:hypothetical protein